jgi:hypothetical protein
MLARPDWGEQDAGGGRGNYMAIWSRERRRSFVYLHMLYPARLHPGAAVRAGQRVGAAARRGAPE